MANIRTYDAPNFSLTESDKGGQAWSQAGRRLGPLYNEAAQFTREAGKLNADNKAQLWPFDILELYQRHAAEVAAAEAAKAAGGGGGGGGGGRPRRGGGGGGGGGGEGGGGEGGGGEGGGGGSPNGQISRGAGALGDALNDGGQAMSRRPQQARPGAPPEPMVLEGGNLVTRSASQKAFQQYQADKKEKVDQWTDDAVNTRNYWTRYNGGDPSQTNQGGTSSTGPQSDFGGGGTPPPSGTFDTNQPYGPGPIQPTTEYGPYAAPSTGGFFSGLASSIGNAFSGGGGDSGGGDSGGGDSGGGDSGASNYEVF